MQRVPQDRLTGEPVVDCALELGVSDTEVLYLAYKYSLEQEPVEKAAVAKDCYYESGEIDEIVQEFAIDLLSGRLDVEPSERKALPKEKT